jgi:hypothetical protein
VCYLRIRDIEKLLKSDQPILDSLEHLRNFGGVHGNLDKLKAVNKPLIDQWIKFCNFIGKTEIDKRKNWISKEDYRKAVKTLKKGDIILTGLYRTIGWAAVIRGFVNHTIYYAGNGKIIHASHEKGVQEKTLKWLCSYYDGFIVLRMKDYEKNKKLIPKLDKFMHRKIGRGYNYSFAERGNTFVCTQLINEGFKHAGYRTKLKSFKGPYKKIRKYVPLILVLKAADVLSKGNFDIAMTTHNYKIKNDELYISVAAQKNHLNKKFLYDPKIKLKNK